MLRQMSQLIEFDGVMARIAIKQAWYDKGKSYLPMITEAFQQTFQREIQINIEKGISSNSTSAKKILRQKILVAFSNQLLLVTTSKFRLQRQ